MDMERSIKRLAIMLIASIVIIMIAKAMLVRAATNVGHAAVEKSKQVAARQIMSRPASSPSATTDDKSPADMPVSAVDPLD